MTINHLIMLGEKGVVSDEIFSRKLLWSLPINPRVRTLSFVDLANLMRGLAILENTKGDYVFGSTTVMGKLLKILREKNTEDNDKKLNDLIDWMLTNRNNPYIPFGINVPLKIKSLKDYSLYEIKRYKHREKMEAENQKRSEIAKFKKIKNITEHKERNKENMAERVEIVKKTKRLKTVNRLKWISEHDHPINIYPEEYAEISIDELQKMSNDLLEKVYLKLKHAKKATRWRILRNNVKDYLQLDKKDNSFVPNYIILEGTPKI